MNRTTRTALAALMLTAAPVVALAQGTSGTDMTTGGTGATTGTTTGDMATGSTAGTTTGSTDTTSASPGTGTTTTYGSPATGSTATDATGSTGTTTGGMGSTATDTGSATGSTSTASSGSGDTQVLAEVEKPSKGNARQRTAETQRALLNRFSQLGFANVREFRREGETYITEAQTSGGDWVSVVLDPESGTIVQRK